MNKSICLGCKQVEITELAEEGGSLCWVCKQISSELPKNESGFIAPKKVEIINYYIPPFRILNGGIEIRVSECYYNQTLKYFIKNTITNEEKIIVIGEDEMRWDKDRAEGKVIEIIKELRGLRV